MAPEPPMPVSGLSLLGSVPGSVHAQARNMAIALRISESQIQDMEQAGKNLRFVTGGSTPTFKFGSRSIDITMSPEKFTRELFRASPSETLQYVGHVSHRARLVHRPTTTKYEEQDEAVLALTSSMAAIRKEKQASQTHLANGFLPIPKNRREAVQQQKRGGLLAVSKHLQSSSPSAGAIRVPAQPPTSVPTDIAGTRTRAMRGVLAHLLAMGDVSTAEVISKTHIPEAEVLPLLQTMAQTREGKWRLSDKSYKELDVWKFQYPEQKDRDAAVDGAVRAYDRMRLSKDNNLWQLLLRQEERGKGTVLSRLHLNSAQAALTPRVESPLLQPDDYQSSAANTPRVGPSGTPKLGGPKKTGGDVVKRLLSKDPKKARAAEEAKEKKRKERQPQDDEVDARSTKRQATTATGGKKNPPVKSQEFVHSSDDEQVNEPVKTNGAGIDNKQKSTSHVRTVSSVTSGQKREPAHARVSPQTNKANAITTQQTINKVNTGKLTPQLQQTKPTTAKSRAHISPPKPVTRPTVPSPLGAARPRVQSDVSDRSGISNQRHNKAVDAPKGLGITNPARKRHDTVTGMESSEDLRGRLKKSPANISSRENTKGLKQQPAHVAPNLTDHDAQQISRKSSANTSTNTQSSEERFDGAISDSSASVIDHITFNQGVDLAHDFKTTFYPRYAKLYDTIADKRTRGEVVAEEDFDKLLEWQSRLKQMKHEIEAAAARKNDGHSS